MWRCRGACRPRSPPLIAMGGMMDDRLSSPTVPSCPGQSCAGSGGATPGQRRPSLFVLSSLRIENVRVLDNRAALAGGPAAPRSPRRLRLGQGWTRHAGTPTHQFSSPDAPPGPSSHVLGQLYAGGRGRRCVSVREIRLEYVRKSGGTARSSSRTFLYRARRHNSR
jgi:hypothetical protein